MAGRPSVHYIVLNANEYQFWQMLTTMWMGHYWELSSSICPEMWWPSLQSNDWQSSQHNWEQPGSLGGCDAAEPDGREDFNGPHEPEIVPHKDGNDCGISCTMHG